MKITIITTSFNHPVNSYLDKWMEHNKHDHEIELVFEPKEATGGDFLFLIACNDIVPPEIYDKYRFPLSIHTSNVPEGKGWSPHVWQIIEGKNTLVVSLLELEENLNSGPIWKQETINLEGHELYNEINEAIFETAIQLMGFALHKYQDITPVKQADIKSTYYNKRTPQDSEIDINSTLAENFNLLRIADPNRYPAFFEYQNHLYKITIKKL